MGGLGRLGGVGMEIKARKGVLFGVIATSCLLDENMDVSGELLHNST